MKLKVSEIKPNPNNPRVIKDDKFKKLVQSIKDFPEMADVREVVVNKDHVILGGNMRFKAMVEAGWKEIPVRVVDWSEDKQREFTIKDNVSGGEWDWDMLANDWENEQLEDWGLLSLGESAKLGDLNESDEWVGMPEFAESNDSFKIIIHFETESDRELFLNEYPLKFAKKESKAWITWFPYREKDDVGSIKYE